MANESAAAIQEMAHRRRATPRIEPQHIDRLSEARYDMQAVLRADITEGQILGMFLDEGLEAWLTKKLAELRLAAAKKERTK